MYFDREQGCALLAVLLLLTLVSTAYAQQPEAASERDQRLEAFLLDDTPAAFELLSREPDLLQERTVQVKVYRSLRSKDPEVLGSAYRLCLQVPDLNSAAPMIGRRCDAAFIGPDPAPKRLLLEFALQEAALTQDLRVLGLVNSALHSEDPGLADLGKRMVSTHPDLDRVPAILEARPEGRQTLPDYQAFKTDIDPILMASGADERACVSCHNSRPVLFLPDAGPEDDEEEMIRRRYRSTLLVVDLDSPEQSLILDKPTRPEPEHVHGAVGPEHHSGGARFATGDETYLRILKWIRSAREHPQH